MRTALAALALVACTSSERPVPSVEAPPAPPALTLALPGITLALPAEWFPLEPDRVEALRASAVRESPNATVALVGLRHPDGFSRGAVYVQRSDTARAPIAEEATVRETLEWFRDDLKARLVAEGLEVLRFDFVERDDGLDGCLHARTTRDGKTVTIGMCLRFAAPDMHRVTVWTANCMTGPGQAESESECETILATRRLEPEPTLTLDEILPANAPPPVPLPAIGLDAVAGLVFGSSPPAFRAACRKSKLSHNTFDWDQQAPILRTWVNEGRVAACSGLPLGDGSGSAFDLGKVHRVEVIFTDGRLSSATLDIDADFAVVEDRLTTTYPRGIEKQGRRIHIIHHDAVDDELYSVGMGPPFTPAAKFSLTFLSRRNIVSSPLVPPPDAP